MADRYYVLGGLHTEDRDRLAFEAFDRLYAVAAKELEAANVNVRQDHDRMTCI